MAKVERFEDEALGHTSQQCRVCSPAAPGADLARGRKRVETKKNSIENAFNNCYTHHATQKIFFI